MAGFSGFGRISTGPPQPRQFSFSILMIYLLISQIDSSMYKHQLISGVYKERLPLPIFYDTFIPIIFEYQLPKWNKSELLAFNNFEKADKAVLDLHIDFESLQPIQDTGSNGQYFSTLYKTSTFCNTIQNHFNGIFIQETELKEYIEMLEKCHAHNSVSHVERSIPDFNYNIFASFSEMENDYNHTYYNPLNTENLKLAASATLANARTGIQATLLNMFYAEKFRWVHAVQDCQQQRLPHSLVTLKKLNDTLVELTRKANFGSKYECSLPLDLMSKYYSLPLTDCTYTTNTFVVRLLLPAKLKSASSNSMDMYKLHPVPFHYEGKLCTIQLENEVEERHIHDFKANLTYSTICIPGLLCQSSELSQSNLIDHCATGLISNDITATKDNCRFECEDASWMNSKAQPIVTKVRSDVFVLTTGNKYNDKAKVKCSEGTETKTTEIQLIDTGALQVILPCKCQLIMNTRTYWAEYPCDDMHMATPTIAQIEPWHLHIKDNININDSTTDSEALEYFLMTRKSIYLDDDEAGDDEMDRHHHLHSTTSHAFLWTIVIIAIIILFCLQIYIIHQLRTMRFPYGAGGRRGPTLMDNMIYNARGRRTQQESRETGQFHLLNEQPPLVPLSF